MKIACKKRIVIVISMFFSCMGFTSELPITSPEDVGMSSEKLARTKSSVQALIDNEKIAGASIIVARKGKIVLSETFGMMDQKAKKSMQPDTIFRIYSMSRAS